MICICANVEFLVQDFEYEKDSWNIKSSYAALLQYVDDILLSRKNDSGFIRSRF